jgi:hypothetical protein
VKEFDIDLFIRSLPWTVNARDEDKTLVAGNLRNLFNALKVVIGS